MRIDPLISLGVLCDDVCTITLHQQEITVKKWTSNIKRHQEQTNRNMGISPGNTKIKNGGE